VAEAFPNATTQQRLDDLVAVHVAEMPADRTSLFFSHQQLSPALI
jgi:hypothetical protein